MNIEPTKRVFKMTKLD